MMANVVVVEGEDGRYHGFGIGKGGNEDDEKGQCAVKQGPAGRMGEPC